MNINLPQKTFRERQIVIQQIFTDETEWLKRTTNSHLIKFPASWREESPADERHRDVRQEDSTRARSVFGFCPTTSTEKLPTPYLNHPQTLLSLADPYPSYLTRSLGRSDSAIENKSCNIFFFPKNKAKCSVNRWTIMLRKHARRISNRSHGDHRGSTKCPRGN